MSLILNDLKNKNIVITGGLVFWEVICKAFIENRSNVIVLDIKSKGKIKIILIVKIFHIL